MVNVGRCLGRSMFNGRREQGIFKLLRIPFKAAHGTMKAAGARLDSVIFVALNGVLTRLAPILHCNPRVISARVDSAVQIIDTREGPELTHLV
jgi:hypothetical protein